MSTTTRMLRNACCTPTTYDDASTTTNDAKLPSILCTSMLHGCSSTTSSSCDAPYASKSTPSMPTTMPKILLPSMQTRLLQPNATYASSNANDDAQLPAFMCTTMLHATSSTSNNDGPTTTTTNDYGTTTSSFMPAIMCSTMLYATSIHPTPTTTSTTTTNAMSARMFCKLCPSLHPSMLQQKVITSLINQMAMEDGRTINNYVFLI